MQRNLGRVHLQGHRLEFSGKSVQAQLGSQQWPSRVLRRHAHWGFPERRDWRPDGRYLWLRPRNNQKGISRIASAHRNSHICRRDYFSDPLLHLDRGVAGPVMVALTCAAILLPYLWRMVDEREVDIPPVRVVVQLPGGPSSSRNQQQTPLTS